MTLSAEMAKHQRMAWGTQWQIEGPGDWSDGEIVHLAMVAHERMLEVYEADQEVMRDDYKISKKIRKKVPNVTTTLIVDNTAYISS